MSSLWQAIAGGAATAVSTRNFSQCIATAQAAPWCALLVLQNRQTRGLVVPGARVLATVQGLGAGTPSMRAAAAACLQSVWTADTAVAAAAALPESAVVTAMCTTAPAASMQAAAAAASDPSSVPE